MTVKYNVHEVRTSQGLTIRQLADLSGVSKTQINDIENGLTHPTVYTLCLLSLALKVEPHSLFLMIVTG